MTSVAVAAALALAACGGDGGDSSPTEPAGVSEAPQSTDDGAPGATTATPSGEVDRILNVARPWPIDGFKGDNCLSAGSITMNLLVYDTLLRVPESGEGTAPGLAESMTYDEASMSYTITLRDGLTFSDGSELTAEDVVFSIDQWRNGAFNGVLYASIASAEVVDDLNVRVNLVAPDSVLPYLFMWCNSTVYPSDFGGLAEDEYFQKPISAGPFTVSEWNNPGATETIVLDANPNHWNGPGGGSDLDQIVFQASLDPNQQLLAFEAGEFDLVEIVDPFTALDQDPAVVKSAGILPVTLLALNVGNEKLTDPAARAAISQAIDREELAALLEGSGEAATGVLPINVPGWAEGSTPYSFDPDAAREVLEPLDLDLEILYDSSSTVVSATVEVLAAQLGEVGVDVTLAGSDNGTVVGRASSSDFEMVILQLAAISPTILDPVGALAALYYPWAQADPSVIYEQFLGGASTPDVAAWESAAAAIQDDARSTNAVIGLYNYSPIDVVSTRVSGFNRLRFAIWYADGISIAQ
jgi:ABC-type transport system substrate-binding protein